MFTVDELILLSQVYHDGMTQGELLEELQHLHGTDDETKALINSCIKAMANIENDFLLASLQGQLKTLNFNAEDLQDES